MRKSDIVAVSLFFVLVFLVVAGPFFTIWSLNTLFYLEIPCNLQTWTAIIWLTTVLHGIKITLNKRY